METLKNEIKNLAERQLFLKNQKKTINLQGERLIEPAKAASEHFYNRIRLRQMYMALGILRGKTPEQIERNPKEPINMTAVNDLVKKHATKSVERLSA